MPADFWRHSGDGCGARRENVKIAKFYVHPGPKTSKITSMEDIENNRRPCRKEFVPNKALGQISSSAKA
jgi:hypothetical protein